VRGELWLVHPDVQRVLQAADPEGSSGTDADSDGNARKAKPARRQVAGRTSRSHLERRLEIDLAGLEPPVKEHRFHDVRKWRFDFAWPARKLAVEVQGGIWVGGRHGRGAGIEKDAEKLNEAQLLGWVVLLVTPGQIRRGEAVAWIKRALGK
jgi:very-short-patch-repair endonuclease